VKPDGATKWLVLYRQAVQEPDRKKSKIRIAEAQRAIGLRARELWYAGSTATAERRQLDAALNFLGVLRTIGDEQS
jgi:hypothetical protein